MIIDLFTICILFAVSSVSHSWYSNSEEYEKRQLVPLPRIGRSYFEVKRQGLIPSPRVGRSSSHGFTRDCSSNPQKCNYDDFTNANLHGNVYNPWSNMNNPHGHMHVGMNMLGMVPAIMGRRKRSITSDEESIDGPLIDDFELAKTLRSNPWDWDNVSEDNSFQRFARQLIPAPRVGRSGSNIIKNNALISGLSAASIDDDSLDPIDLQLRAAFIPRIGKRSEDNSYDDGRYADLNEYLKRAASFTPRIGRAAFTPRIGKKAAFVPRIGRSVEKVDSDVHGRNSHSSV